MTAPDNTTWVEANQRWLSAELARVRVRLERHAAGARGEAGGPVDADEQTVQMTGALPERSALDGLCTAFGLSPFEREIVLLAAGLELDSRFAALCAAAQGDAGCRYLTFSLALAVCPQAHWQALTPGAALRL